MKPNYFAIIPANVRYDSSLTPNAKLLYGELTALSNQEGYCWASNSYFAELYGVSNTSISKWISNLENRGYIKSEIRYKRGTKQIEERRIYIVDNSGLINTPIRKVKGGIEEKLNTPIEEKLKDNSTVYNNTINKDNRSTQKEKPKNINITKEEVKQIIDKWNSIAKNTKIPQIRSINKNTKRYNSLNARYKDYGLETLIEGIDSIRRSSFLRGETKNWTITFDWYLLPNNIIKVLEGNYIDKSSPASSTLNNQDYRVSTKEDLVRDDKGNLISF